MTERIEKMLEGLKNREYEKNYLWRKPTPEIIIDESLSDFKNRATVFKMNCDNEQPYFHEFDSLGFNRYVSNMQYRSSEIPFWNDNGNVSPNYEGMLNGGFNAYIKQIKEKMVNCTAEQKDLYQAMLSVLDSAQNLADRYKEAAKESGRTDIFDALCVVPKNAAQTYYQALVFLKFIIYTLRLNFNIHITLGRFDQYMLPFYTADLKRGIKREKLLELTEEFFISINYDSRLYVGVQQGDNGQSMVLGGCDKNGNDALNDLSMLCMEATLELNIIDPKINLRVNKNTPIEVLEYASLMTKQGMGFPQYCNDDVVIDGLVKLGYDIEDARDYAVAACWEFVIPAKGADWPNKRTMNFPLVLEKTCKEQLCECNTFDELLVSFKANIECECERLANSDGRDYLPDPYLSIFIEECINSGKDISQHGAKYNNDGCHGAGIATAVDSLIAIKKAVYEEGICSKQYLLNALEANFSGYEELRNKLLGYPKMGNDEDEADEIANTVMKCFSDSMNLRKSARGGIFRAGTGSAMEYILSAKRVGATADGRYAASPYGSSFSPSLECKTKGVLSCIKSFTKYDLSNIINGGPITIEMHSSVFRNEDGIKKVAKLVKFFIDRGGHQLQLNSVNRDVLINAQKNPEDYKNLIVRVWGWSGYFTELDKCYQDHIIKRTEFSL